MTDRSWSYYCWHGTIIPHSYFIHNAVPCRTGTRQSPISLQFFRKVASCRKCLANEGDIWRQSALVSQSVIWHHWQNNGKRKTVRSKTVQGHASLFLTLTRTFVLVRDFFSYSLADVSIILAKISVS